MQPLNEIWEIALEEMQNEFSNAMINIWYRPLEINLLDSGEIEVLCENEFKLDQMSGKYLPTIMRYLTELMGYEPKLVFGIKGTSGIRIPAVPAAAPEIEAEPSYYNNAAEEKPGIKTEQSSSPTRMQSQHSVGHMGSAPSREPIHDPTKVVLEGGKIEVTNHATRTQTYKDEYTFANYIVGASNTFAHAACVAVASEASYNYNPLFIYGQSGLGKTHLLYAITNEVLRREPNYNIIYVKGDEFTNQLIESIQMGITAKFRDKYRQADVLLIDDIQFIAGKDSTQEEFFHTFNALHEARKQIIMTSDRPPKDMKTLEDRLKTRFEWGLIVDVQPPDYELRLAIVRKKAEMMRLEVPEDVFVFLAENLRSNVRQLEGAIKKIGAQAYLTGIPITKELAISCTSDIITGQEPVKVTVEKIIEKVSRKYGVPVGEIKGRKRSKDIAQARHTAIYLIRKLTDMSLPQIARVFERDHTTIMSSIDNIDTEIKSNSLLEIEIGELIKEIRE